jgi:hypothetical protein
MSAGLGWYARRLRQMSPPEVAQRSRAYVRQKKWSTRQVRPGSSAPSPAGMCNELRNPVGLHEAARDPVPTRVRAAVQDAADQVLAGTWPVLGVPRDDLADPDWFRDPVTGHSAPREDFAFGIDHRDESVTGNVKLVWELSRHHHLTVLAAAFWVSGDEKYAEAVDRQLRSWWRQNPFLSGVHWTSGIELGVRLVSWVWIRRLLDEWPKVQDLFEHNEVARQQVCWHQDYLAAFPSHGSSANNHAIAEAAGLLVGSCGFPWFDRSDRWREQASARLRLHLATNTFEDGLNRELATDYHRFVTELGLVAAVEARAAGHDLGPDLWQLLSSSLDAAAALVDCAGRPPRQGDGDEGRALVLDDDSSPWAQLLSAGAETVGAMPWWPKTPPSLFGTLLGALADRPHVTVARPAAVPTSFAGAGLVLLRSSPDETPEIWCRCDGGPHGFLSIAAHAHADALSIEVRHDGVDILADPGTYCYHGEPEWRSYFRSTRAHNTIRLGGRDQSTEGGPFLWSDHADARLLRDDATADGERIWAAMHNGYRRLSAGGARHQRTVRLGRDLKVSDLLASKGRHDVEMFYHLGPEVAVELDGVEALLTWSAGAEVRRARISLPSQLSWTPHRAETDPIAGWYSPMFGQRVPCTTLIGVGRLNGRLSLETLLTFGSAERGDDRD